MVIKSADVHVSAEKQVKAKKKVFTSADVHFSAPKQVKTLTLPLEKKNIMSAGCIVYTETLQNFSWKNDLTCFHCS